MNNKNHTVPRFGGAPSGCRAAPERHALHRTTPTHDKNNNNNNENNNNNT